MTDSRATFDDAALPWLEAVDDEDAPRGLSARRMLAALLVVLIAGAVVAGTFFWLGRRDPVVAGGAPELIRADPGPYKVKPADPGGLDVAGESETAFQTSAGEDTDSQLDLNALRERPLARPTEQEPKRLPPTDTKEPVEAEQQPKPATPSGATGSVVQLGAFKNAAQAERAWTSLSSRFPSVASMTKIVLPFPGGYRLRAGGSSPTEARQACQSLRAAGENCFVAN